MADCRVELRRDNVGTAWGLRLQGGLDFNSPLVVQRVFSGSPADGQLQRGDILVSVNNHDASRMQQKQAEELIRSTGSALSLVVRRSPGGAHISNAQPFASQPSQPVHRPFDVAPSQPKAHPGPSFSASQPKRTAQANVWSPSGGGSNYQPSFDSSQHIYGDSSHEPMQNAYGSAVGHGHEPHKVQRPAGFSSQQQFSVQADFDHAGQGTQKASPSWQGHQAPGVRSHQHISPPQPHAGHHDRFHPQQEVGNHGYPPYDDGRRAGPPQVISSNQAEDDELYEAKSVRDLKQMFNKPSRPPTIGARQQPNRPRLWEGGPPPVVSHQTASGRPKPVSPMRTFSPPSQPIHSRPAALYPQHPQQQSPQPMPATTPSLIPAKPFIQAPKPGAGYSYQGIVTVTPPKKQVHHGGGTAGGGGGKPGEKKEFDPSQSLVYQMLQEENERRKRGEPMIEEEAGVKQPPRGRGAARPQPQQPQYQVQQSSGRLQELLERDRAASQQEEQARQAELSPPQMHHQQRTQHVSVHHYSTPQQQGVSYSVGHQPGGYQHQQAAYAPAPHGGPSSHGYYQQAPQHMTSYQTAYEGGDMIPISDF